jgi:tRNA-(ms[2]io[6]A)-hydroxylase
MSGRIPLVPSSPRWVEAALAELPRLLLDHAHCEKKAASMALRHVTRYGDWPRLATQMSRLAREELVHFERVLDELHRRGLDFRGQPGSGYGAALMARVRPPSPSRSPTAAGSCLGDRTVDELLICTLIEARSHERFERLAEAVPDKCLAGLYADLCEAEARHGELYLALAEEAAGGDVSARLAELCAYEARVVSRPGMPLRMHAGGSAGESLMR